jgi:hypothetical protein
MVRQRPPTRKLSVLADAEAWEGYRSRGLIQSHGEFPVHLVGIERNLCDVRQCEHPRRFLPE